MDYVLFSVVFNTNKNVSLFVNFREDWDCSQSVVPPITMTSNFIMSGTAEVPGEFLYGRYGNPSRGALEATLAALEDAKYALAFSSGIA